MYDSPSKRKFPPVGASNHLITLLGSLRVAVTVTGSPTQKSVTPVVVGPAGTASTSIVSVAEEATEHGPEGTS